MPTDPPIDPFKLRAVEGYKWQLWVEEELRKEGINTQVHPLRIRPTFTEPGEWSDKYDLMAGSDLEYHIEVKSRNTPAFTCVDDFPYDTIFIETLNSWNKRAKNGTPDWWVVVNRDTAGSMAIPAHTSSTWVEERGRGGERVMAAEKKQWKTLAEMCEEIGG